MSAPPLDNESSQSSSGYEDGLGRRVLAFDRETGGMLERLILRPELCAFEQALTERIAIVAGMEDERFARPRGIERNADDHLIVVSEYLAGRRLSDIIEAAAEHGIVAGLDAGLGLLLELLPAIARLHDAGLIHGAIAPGRVMITPANQVVLLDSIYGEPLQRLQLTRKRLWAELRLAFPPTAGTARFDNAADLGHASMVAATLIVGRALQNNDYPEGISILRQEILEIASIRGSKGFAEAVDKFFASTLPLVGRRVTASADEAAIDLRKLVRKELGINTCRTALMEFLQQVDAADAERAAAEAAERERRAAEEAPRLAQQQAEAAERLERERLEKARLDAERKERERLATERREHERLEAERKARERAEAERGEQERLDAERLERERAEKARLDAERLERERLEAERKARERAEVERREQERLDAERLERERAEKVRLEAERLERERLEAERRERERLEAERLERERAEKARLEAERLERERLEAERRERERLEAERLERERAERDRLEAERIERERVEAERKERERLEAERKEQARREKARLEAERIERERAEKARLEAERRERERAEAERLERERTEQARVAAEKLERERRDAERVAEEARLKAERLEREQLEAARQAERARLEAERLEQQRADAERRERERVEAERRERERIEREHAEADRLEADRAASGAAAPESVPEPEPEPAAPSTSWLIPPGRAATFEPPVPHDPRPAPTVRPYPLYVPPSEPASWNADMPPVETPPADIIAPIAAASPPIQAMPTPVPLAAAPAAPAPIRLKMDGDAPPTAPARSDHRGEPESDNMSAAGSYEPYRTSKPHQPIPWKLIAAGVVLIAGTFAISKGYTPAAAPVVDTVRKVMPKPSAGATPAPIAGNLGRLTITTQPPGAKIVMDGKPAGETPLTLDSVKPGRHVILLTSPEGSARRTVRVEAGQTLALDVPLYSGFVAISVPFVVNVSENGKALGTSENQILLSPGRHELHLSNKDLAYAATEAVEVQPGEVARLDLDPRGRANINAVPWAEVWIDGEKAGETPMANVPIRLGVREIVFKNPQFPDRKQTVTITGSAAATISVDFMK